MHLYVWEVSSTSHACLFCFAISCVFQLVNLCRREYWLPYELTKNDSEILRNSTFDPSRPTKVLCHGFMNSYMNDMEQDILDGK